MRDGAKIMSAAVYAAEHEVLARGAAREEGIL